MTDQIIRAWLDAGHESEREVLAREWPALHDAIEEAVADHLRREAARAEMLAAFYQAGQAFGEFFKNHGTDGDGK